MNGHLFGGHVIGVILLWNKKSLRYKVSNGELGNEPYEHGMNVTIICFKNKKLVIQSRTGAAINLYIVTRRLQWTTKVGHPRKKLE